MGARTLVLLGHWRDRLTPLQLLAVTLVVGLGATAALAALAGEVYEAVVESDWIAVLDQPVLQLAESSRSALGISIATGFTTLGGTVGMPIIATVVAVTLSVAWRAWTPLLLVAATAAGSLTLTVVGKAVVGRARPPLAAAVAPFESSPSFPSGHSLNSMAVAGIVAYLLVLHQRRALPRVVTIAAAASFAVAMGLTRVYLGHHWLTDVVVAWTLGLSWVAVVVTAHRLYLLREPRGRAAATVHDS